MLVNLHQCSSPLGDLRIVSFPMRSSNSRGNDMMLAIFKCNGFVRLRNIYARQVPVTPASSGEWWAEELSEGVSHLICSPDALD